jgi:hypothetical protein
MHKRDSFLFGILVSIIGLAFGYGFFYMIGLLLNELTGIEPYFQAWQLRAAAIIPNVLLMRYYFINLKMDKTGRSILAFTFFIIVGYFLFLKLFYN